MKRTEILDTAEDILEKAGFQLSGRCKSRPSCFDFIAQKKKKIALIKVYINISNVFSKDAHELRKISGCFSATSIIIGEKTRRKPLEDDTVYSRYNICAVNLKTLEDAVLHEMRPLVEAGPGGYYIKVDGKLIRKHRQKLGLSVGKMAEMMGISRRTLYGYEREMAKASVSAAYKLEWVLGIPVVQLIDVFQPISQDAGFLAKAKRRIVKHRFLQMVFGKFAQFDFKATQTDKAPFDFIAQCPEESLKIVGGVADKQERNVDQRADEIISVGKVVNAQPVFITDGEKIPNNNIPLIHSEDLMKMHAPEDFLAQL
jgi:putative transcriptional regulator